MTESSREATAINRQRLCQQRLTANPLATPEEVVAWFGAVQAQDYAGAKWALGLRMEQATDALIGQAFNEGRIVRTHVLRPTWHFVMPDDIRWMLALTSPRVNAASAHMYHQLDLDDAIFAAGNEIIAGALQGGRQLTREELGAALNAGGIPATGTRLGYIIMRAELDAVVCSGPRRGKQFTYMLLEERAPNARVLAHDEALAELTRRYFTGHGPATERDFAWWSGLSLADVRRGLDAASSHLVSQEHGGVDYWFSRSTSSIDPTLESTLLLSTYDEFFMGFTGDSRPGWPDVKELIFDSMIVIDGRIVGTWRRTFQKGTAVVEVKTVAGHPETDERIRSAGERFGAFLEMPVRVEPVSVRDFKSTGWRQSRVANPNS